MDWELFGSCFARDDAIHVTDAEQDQKGAAWARRPLKTISDWQVDLTFRVGGTEGDLFGDGFGFWLSEERGRGGDALGGPNKWEGLGVFFDTYKNKEFRGKRHPYVYALTNDGKLDYSKIKTRDITNGCHIPFRSAHTKDMATTVARITYTKKTLSVIMQPKGAIEWVQCIKLDNLDIPGTDLYFGVTAMTGQLVDKHHMVEIKAYTNIELDPYEYAQVNDQGNMPGMWEDILAKGNVAREFEGWEKKIMEETQFDHDEGEDDYEDYYEYGYANREGDEGEDEDYDEDYEEDDPIDKSHHSKDREEQLRRMREAYERRKEGRDLQDKDGKKSNRKFSRAELVSISEILARTKTGREIKRMQDRQKEKLKSVRQHLEAEISDTVDQLTNMVRDIRAREHHMNQRIVRLAQRLKVAIEPLEEAQESAGTSWLWPFLILLACIIGLASTGYRKYNSYMKTHLL